LREPVIRLAADDTAVVTNMDANVAEDHSMNSFTLTAVGNLARNPEAVAKGDITYTRFCLIGTDYAGKDDEGAPREIVTSLWFVAFGALGESVVRNARKGDQLIVEARVRANNWTDKQGGKQYDLDFVVQGFRFGAPGKIKREERDARRGEERGNGRDERAPAAAGDDGRATNGHVNSNAKPNQGSAAEGNAGANDDTSVNQTASGSSATTAEKPTSSRSGRRAAAPPP
jgi:single-strand DNA-binding protein